MPWSFFTSLINLCIYVKSQHSPRRHFRYSRGKRLRKRLGIDLQDGTSIDSIEEIQRTDQKEPQHWVHWSVSQRSVFCREAQCMSNALLRAFLFQTFSRQFPEEELCSCYFYLLKINTIEVLLKYPKYCVYWLQRGYLVVCQWASLWFSQFLTQHRTSRSPKWINCYVAKNTLCFKDFWPSLSGWIF